MREPYHRVGCTPSLAAARRLPEWLCPIGTAILWLFFSSFLCFNRLAGAHVDVQVDVFGAGLGAAGHTYIMGMGKYIESIAFSI